MHAKAIGCLAPKQLSAVVASGASTAKAEEGNTLISSRSLSVCFQLPACVFRLLSFGNSHMNVKPRIKSILIALNASLILYRFCPVKPIL